MDRPWVRVLPPEPRKRLRFNEEAGLKNMPPDDAKPVQYFLLLCTMQLIREIVRQTNKYARRFISTSVIRRYSRVHVWKPVTVKEFLGFIAVVLNMGLIRKPTIAEYWNKSQKSQQTQWFRNMFSRNRFQLILKFLHVVDNRRVPDRNSQAYRPDAKFKPLLDHANMMFPLFFQPGQNICVDETLVGTRGRTVMKQYIPTKRSKFGVKFWMLADSATGYIVRMNCYLGKVFDKTLAPVGKNVVLDLLKQCRLLNKGYHVFTDSFFTSVDLAKELIRKHTYITGTLRANRPMPKLLKTLQPLPDRPVIMRQGNILVGSQKDNRHNKTFRIVTTGANASSRRGLTTAIRQYNASMGGVDESDKMLSYYHMPRKSLKVWKKIFFHIIHRMIQNSYILYKNNTSEDILSQMKFMQDVIESLSVMYNQTGSTTYPEPGRAELITMQGRKEKDCMVCSDRQIRRRRSRTQCSLCLRGCHRGCWRRHGCNEIVED